MTVEGFVGCAVGALEKTLLFVSRNSVNGETRVLLFELGTEVGDRVVIRAGAAEGAAEGKEVVVGLFEVKFTTPAETGRGAEGTLVVGEAVVATAKNLVGEAVTTEEGVGATELVEAVGCCEGVEVLTGAKKKVERPRVGGLIVGAKVGNVVIEALGKAEGTEVI